MVLLLDDFYCCVGAGFMPNAVDLSIGRQFFGYAYAFRSEPQVFKITFGSGFDHSSDNVGFQ